MKIRTRNFQGRCARHKGYNPAVDGAGGIKANCQRCHLLLEIWETSLKLNALIRKYDPNYDDVKRPPRKSSQAPAPDPRQLSLI